MKTVITLGVFALLATTQCSSRYSKFCETEKNCVGGNDADYDACIAEERASEDIADAYDCADQWDTYASCKENATCNNGSVQTACTDQSKALSDCKSAGKSKRPQPAPEPTPGGG
jgi:hypothetical protein